MKLEIWEEPKVAGEEKVTRLRLVPGARPGYIRVVAVSEKGMDIGGGSIAEFSPEGLTRRKHLTSFAGFALDSSGLIKELESF